MAHDASLQFLVAADSGDTVEVRRLLIDVNARHMGHHTSPAFNAGGTALMYAARSGHLDTVVALLALGADVAALDKERWNALHYAAFNGHAEISKLLLDKGTPSNVKTQYENATPLEFARHRRFDESVCVLGGVVPTPPLTTEEREECRTKNLRKFNSGGKVFLFRYAFVGGAQETVRGFLTDGMECWVDAVDNVIPGSDGRHVSVHFSEDHARHLAEAVTLRAAGVPVLRVSSVSAIEHIIVVPRDR